jgi:uncharacterized repeat protein (TIGR01451 family)
MYGGCDPDDDRGTMQYVRIEFASGGLQLVGVGRGTAIDEVQVHGAQSSGVTVGGGTADLRHVLVTAAQGDGLTWRDGWRGRSQFLIVQLDPASGASGVVGFNAIGDPDASPVSRPLLYNTSVVGTDFPPTGAALELLGGTGAVVRNFVAVGAPTPAPGIPVGVDVDGAETCALIGTDLSVGASVFGGVDMPGDPDVDVGCPGSPLVEDALIAADGNLVVSTPADVTALIKAAADPLLPDFRGGWTGALAAFSASVPPSDGFFDPGSVYPGGSAIATPSQPNIPWHAGWTRGGLGTSLPLGGIQGTVSDGTSPLAGISVVAEAGDFAGLTDAAGFYELAWVRPGVTTVSLDGLSSDCLDPGSIPASVTAGAVTTLDIVVQCGLADVGVDKSGPPSATLADTLLYVLTTTNHGPGAAHDVIVSDTLPVGATFVAASRQAIEGGGVVTWPGVSLAVGGSIVDSVRVVVAAAGPAFDIAAVATSTADLNPSNDVDSMTTLVGGVVTGLVWENEFADEAVATPVTIGDVTVSVAGSDPSGIGRAGNFSVEYDALGTHAGFWVVDVDATSRSQSVTFGLSFSAAIDSLRFTLLDVDRRVGPPQFQDSVTVRGWNGTTSFAPTVESIGSETHQTAPGVFAGETEVTGLAAANVALRFDQPVDSVTFVYGPGPASASNPAQQTVGISDLTWSVLTLGGSPSPPLPPAGGGEPPQPGAPPPDGPEDR